MKTQHVPRRPLVGQGDRDMRVRGPATEQSAPGHRGQVSPGKTAARAAGAVSTRPAGWLAVSLGVALLLPSPARAQFSINEILPNPASAADPEWVEIFNAGAMEGSLAGWTIAAGVLSLTVIAC